MASALGYVRVAGIVPRVTLAQPMVNAATLAELARKAGKQGAQVIIFPELSLTGYTCGDLFLQDTLLESAQQALRQFLEDTEEVLALTVLGMPLRVDDQLFNVAVVCLQGRVLAVVPKTFIPNYKEFYELRHFSPASHLRQSEIKLCGRTVPIGTDLVLETFIPELRLGIEICEDLWMPNPPSSTLALQGATLLLNLSASNGLVGKAEYRRALVTNQSARCVAAYVYVSCGPGESTSDVVFDGHAMIAENGSIVVESKRFQPDGEIIITDVDLGRLVRERGMTSSFSQAAAAQTARFRRVFVPVEASPFEMLRKINPLPFVPEDPATRDENCQEVFHLQTAGLQRRLQHLADTIGRKVVIGISGGLDSTLALLVTVRAFKALSWDLSGICAVTMPGFGTTDETLTNALELCAALGVPVKTIPITDAVLQHLKDIGHEPDRHCLICQNAQARERTQILMDMGFVIGTGDLSEAALGWCTFNGDHMSMYNPNCGVPKTLVKFVVQWVVNQNLMGDRVSAVLQKVVDTIISPELEPPDAEGKIAQKTEDIVGPYDLNDFFLFHVIRNGFAPYKILWLAENAFQGTYDHRTILGWLVKFLRRFASAQFKRNAVPDGPKIGSVSLSPRGDWRMPADVILQTWLDELERLPSGR